MKFTVRVLQQNFLAPLTIPNLTFEVQRYSFSAMGGPKTCEISITGNQRALWELLEWLRAPIEVLDERSTVVWWGFIHEIQFNVGVLDVSVSLDGMYNRVAIAYSQVEAGSTSSGTRATTAWIQDDDSVAAYGTKELLSTLSKATAMQADATQSAILDGSKYPQPKISVGQAAKGESSGRITCRGWYSTLDWKYYAQLTGKVAYETDGSGVQNVGDISGNTRVAQSFQVTDAAGWELAAVKIKAKKVGAPTDDFTLEICSDSGGIPGGLLTSKTINGAVMSTSIGWVEFTMESLSGGGYVFLQPSTPYWLVLRRSGANDGTNYYQVDVNEDLGYTGGVFKKYNGAAWSARSPDADMNFQVLGGKETTEQIIDLIGAGGQFLTGTLINDRSNIMSNHYRKGDNTCLFELEELLKSGVLNGRRLLAMVSPTRELIVSEEPAKSSASVEYFLKKDGTLENVWGDKHLKQTCPVGAWARLKDVIPSSLDLGRLADPSLFFIEEAEYDARQDSYLPSARGQESAWDIGTRIIEG